MVHIKGGVTPTCIAKVVVTRPLEMLQSLQCAVLMGNIHVGLCPDIIKWCTIPAPDETSFPSEPASDHKLKIPPVHSQHWSENYPN